MPDPNRIAVAIFSRTRVILRCAVVNEHHNESDSEDEWRRLEELRRHVIREIECLSASENVPRDDLYDRSARFLALPIQDA